MQTAIALPHQLTMGEYHYFIESGVKKLVLAKSFEHPNIGEESFFGGNLAPLPAQLRWFVKQTIDGNTKVTGFNYVTSLWNTTITGSWSVIGVDRSHYLYLAESAPSSYTAFSGGLKVISPTGSVSGVTAAQITTAIEGVVDDTAPPNTTVRMSASGTLLSAVLADRLIVFVNYQYTPSPTYDFPHWVGAEWVKVELSQAGAVSAQQMSKKYLIRGASPDPDTEVFSGPHPSQVAPYFGSPRGASRSRDRWFYSDTSGWYTDYSTLDSTAKTRAYTNSGTFDYATASLSRIFANGYVSDGTDVLNPAGTVVTPSWLVGSVDALHHIVSTESSGLRYVMRQTGPIIDGITSHYAIRDSAGDVVYWSTRAFAHDSDNVQFYEGEIFTGYETTMDLGDLSRGVVFANITSSGGTIVRRSTVLSD